MDFRNKFCEYFLFKPCTISLQNVLPKTTAKLVNFYFRFDRNGERSKIWKIDRSFLPSSVKFLPVTTYNQDLSLGDETADRAAEEQKKPERQTAISQLATPQRRLRSGIPPLNRQEENSERPEFPLKFRLLATL